MDTKFQTSFIPKKTVGPGLTGGRPESVSVALLVSIIIFMLSLAAAGGVFFYKRVLIRNIDKMNGQLVQAKNSFDPESIEKWSRFDKRIDAAAKILASHSVVSPIFDLLQNDTLATVKFNNFSLDLKDNGSASVSMTGEAKSFSSVANQSDIINREKFIKNPVFSDLNPNQSGNVVFKFNGSLDPALISYKNNLRRGSASASAN